MNPTIESLNYLLLSQFGWGVFWLNALILATLYIGLRFARRLTKRVAFFQALPLPLKEWIHYLLLGFEPLAIVILVSIFIMIRPIFHGMIVAILTVSAFSHIRNYMSGRLVLVDHTLALGRQLTTQNLSGLIVKASRFGVYLQTGDGRHFMSYTRLVNNGYSVDLSEDIGGFFHLKISPVEDGKSDMDSSQFMDRLITAPYLDLNYKPELVMNQIDSHQKDLEINVLVKDEMHIHELISLMREWGYRSQILST